MLNEIFIPNSLTGTSFHLLNGHIFDLKQPSIELNTAESSLKSNKSQNCNFLNLSVGYNGLASRSTEHRGVLSASLCCLQVLSHIKTIF
jgi:hypothetical protein